LKPLETIEMHFDNIINGLELMKVDCDEFKMKQLEVAMNDVRDLLRKPQMVLMSW